MFTFVDNFENKLIKMIILKILLTIFVTLLKFKTVIGLFLTKFHMK